MAYRGVHLAPYNGVLTVGREFLLWWDFIDGLYLSRGVNLIEVFGEVGPVRMFNVIDSILIEEGLRHGETDGAIEKSRTAVLKVYNSSQTNQPDYSENWGEPPVEGVRSDPARPAKNFIPQIAPTEAGYAGLEPPVG